MPAYPLIPAFSPKGEKESEAQAAHERVCRSGSLSPIGGEGRGEGAVRPCLQKASFSVLGYPLIPAFSPKGEKGSEAQVAYERARRSDSLSPIGGEGWGEGAGRPRSQRA